jgi:succinate dehydrogenase/fumarate reductase cytochrome b subunit
MEQVMKKKPFNKRAFISTALFISVLILPFSGYMNHILQFDTLSIEKHLSMSLHNVAGILFALFVIFHITFNWSALLNYAKKAKEKFVSKETITALALVILVVCLFSSHVFHAN